MNVSEREVGDRDRLLVLAETERHAKQRDRFRAVAMALDDELTQDIADTLGRAKSFVQSWVYAYRDGGIEAIKPVKQTGRRPKLTKDQLARLTKRLDAGPTDKDGVCTLRGRDICSIIETMFNTSYSLNGVYRLLHSMGYSCLKPRPRHEKNSPEAMKAWLEAAPLLSRASAGSTPASKSRSGSRTRPASVRRAR